MCYSEQSFWRRTVWIFYFHFNSVCCLWKSTWHNFPAASSGTLCQSACTSGAALFQKNANANMLSPGIVMNDLPDPHPCSSVKFSFVSVSVLHLWPRWTFVIISDSDYSPTVTVINLIADGNDLNSTSDWHPLASKHPAAHVLMFFSQTFVCYKFSCFSLQTFPSRTDPLSLLEFVHLFMSRSLFINYNVNNPVTPGSRRMAPIARYYEALDGVGRYGVWEVRIGVYEACCSGQTAWRRRP